MIVQIASLVGAAVILAAYGAHQAGWLGRESYSYHLLNALGGSVLCVVALQPLQIGFFVLEVAWTVISLGAIFRLWRRPSRT